MTKPIVLLALLLLTLSANAQSTKTTSNEVPAYGKIDTSELKMMSCSFEKDANAMVLFDNAIITVNGYGEVTLIRHKRIKIFNNEGRSEANIKLPYFDKITDVSAETINLNGGKIEYTPVDPTLIYKKKINSLFNSFIFTFPNVQAGSVIEMQYTWKISSQYFIPTWYFQSNIPVRYSGINVYVDHLIDVKLDKKVNQAFAIDTDYNISNNDVRYVRVLKNVHSLVKEPYMTPEFDNNECVVFKSSKNEWALLNKSLANSIYFGTQLFLGLTNEKSIIKKADSIKNDPDKIDSIFTLVKATMSCSDVNKWYIEDGAQTAWNNKKGNASEINLILCRLLRQAGFNASPMLVSTPDYATVDPNEPFLGQFNKTVVYLPIDSANYYVLDASNKHNAYDQIPFDLLSTYGFAVMIKDKSCGLVYLQDKKISQQLIFVNAVIQPDGKMRGNVDITSNSYNKEFSDKKYNTLGEKEYINYLTGGDNNLKIDSFKMGKAESDTLALNQHFNFDLNLSASDGDYIYFNSNTFIYGSNPFISENRYSNINFMYNNINTITSIYAIPKGYKIESVPQNQFLEIGDKSIGVKRLISYDNGTIQINYLISRKRFIYTKEEYKSLYIFYKKLYEMLNEQIVLKKV